MPDPSQPRPNLDYVSLLKLSRDCAHQQQLDQAILHAKQAIGVDPSRPEAFNLLGVLQETLGDRLTALKNYRVALDLDPTFQPAQRNLDRATTFPGSRE